MEDYHDQSTSVPTVHGLKADDEVLTSPSGVGAYMSGISGGTRTRHDAEGSDYSSSKKGLESIQLEFLSGYASEIQKVTSSFDDGRSIEAAGEEVDEHIVHDICEIERVIESILLNDGNFIELEDLEILKTMTMM